MHASPLATEFRPITHDELENLPYLSLYVFFYDKESKLYSQQLELVDLKSWLNLPICFVENPICGYTGRRRLGTNNRELKMNWYFTYESHGTLKSSV